VFPCCNPFYLRQSSSLLLNSRCVLTAAGVCGFIAFSRPTRPVTSSAYSVAPSARNRKLSWSNKNSALLRSRLSLGGQYGLHNSSDHYPHSAAGRRWRLVRPRALVLGCMYRKLKLGRPQKNRAQTRHDLLASRTAPRSSRAIR